MKLVELFEKVKDELQSDKEKLAVIAIKKRLVEIEELEKALKEAQKGLDELINLDLKDFDYNVW